MILKDENNIIKKVINPQDIYQCSIWHNVIPFSSNPQDKSYCGIGFGYGLKNEFGNIYNHLI